MSDSPVLDQIRTYWEVVDSSLPDARPALSNEPTSSPVWHRWTWAIVTAATVVVLVGALPSLMGVLRSESVSSDVSADQPATTTPALSSIVEGTQSFVVATESLGPLRWTRFEAPDKDTPVSVSVDPNGGYVAYGWSEHVMHSIDGSSWRILSEAEATAALARIDQSYEPASPATLPGRVGVQGEGLVFETNFGYVAWGGDVDSEGGVPSRMWISVDGYEWEMIDEPPPLSETYGFVGGGAYGGTGDLLYWSESALRGSVMWIGRFEG